ncbi:MAG TPA: hypothetical protein PK979_06480 [Bacteroidales bacterium]|nr:hypothetical protein [Bacteroidales bacterium]HPK30669.1 hypothetical protein [Bacteroidales bacterium]
MKKFVRKFWIIHTLLLLALGVGVWVALIFLFPEVEVRGYFVIPLYFYLMGVALFLRFRRISIDKPSKTTNMYMQMRVIKVLISLIIIVVYWLLNKSGVRPFAIVFAVFYLIYLIWETFLFLRMEKHIRYIKSQNEPLN